MKNLFRLIHVAWILSRYRIDTVLKGTGAAWLLKCFVLFNVPAWFRGQEASRGERVRLALESLGPIFVKFGQVLSTRPDLFPEDIVKELIKLQDRVPPFSPELALQIVETAYGKPADQVFKKFDSESLASASIAQVHAATLLDDSDVIVKIVRPNITKVIKKDVRLLFSIAKLARRFLPDGKRMRPVDVIKEFERTIYDELDMQREAANCSQLRRNFDNSDLLYVPKIYWDYVRPNILVQERIYAARINDIEALRDMGCNMKKLAEDGVAIFYTQVFRDKFFHADMHGGNILVDITDPKSPKYCGIDFGIMGSLTDDDQYYLAMNFLAFFNQDYRRVAQLHIDCGWVPATTRVDELESAIRTVCEPIFNKPLSEISYAKVLMRLFQVARRFDMEVQPQLVLLQKTLLNVEGLGRQLYPELNLWETAKPHLESIMKNQIGIRGLLHKVKQRLPYWLEELPEIPGLIHQALEQLAKAKR
tara:strand:- start:4565 stop:5995 length:1431 start_codon:yes stop_codon:yes gene_type:complete